MAALAKRIAHAVHWRGNAVVEIASVFVLDGIYWVRGGLRRADGRRDPKSIGGFRILFVDEMAPDPRLGAGFPRAYEMVRDLVNRGDSVDHYSTSSRPGDVEAINQRFESRVRFHSSHGAKGLKRLLRTHGKLFDLILISRPVPMKAYLAIEDARQLLNPSAVVIYDAESIFSVREAVRRALFGEPLADSELQEMVAEEVAMAAHADLLLSVSESDRQILSTASGKPTFVISHMVEIESSKALFSDRSDILFIGKLAGSRIVSPNVDSVAWFVEAVMPQLDTLVGNDYRLDVVGMTGPEVVELCASGRTALHGIVDQLDPFYDHCKVFIAPTRFSAGLPVKVVEALGYGVPCVVSSLIASLLPVSSLSPVLVGDTPEAFAKQCHRLYSNETLWRTMSERGLAFVQDNYSRDHFHSALSEMLDAAARMHAERSVERTPA